MKALLMNQYKSLEYVDVPTPRIQGDHDVLVKVHAVAICGSDVHGFDGSTGRRIPPIIMGHEASGEVVSTGTAVTTCSQGDRVTFDSTIYCGTCRFCRSGDVNLCDHRRVLGVSCDEYRQDGAFAEYVLVPDHIIYHVPDGLSFEEASLAEPAAVAAHAVRITPIGLDETVAVVGSGLIGLLLIQILRASTCGKIIAFDTDPARRESARFFGADEALDPSQEHSRKADRVFEAVGVAASLHTAIDIVQKNGSVTLIGNVSPSVDLPLQRVVNRQLSLFGSCAIAGEYPIVLDLMARGKIDVKPLISAVAPLQEGQLWFERLYNREAGLLKVVLQP